MRRGDQLRSPKDEMTQNLRKNEGTNRVARLLPPSVPQLQSDHCTKPPVDFRTKVPFWPGQDRTGQSRTFVLMSTGGFNQGDVSNPEGQVVLQRA